MRLSHTACKRGKKVRIKLRTGEIVYGKFHERTKKHVFLQDGTKIYKGDIQVFSILNERLLNMRHGSI